MTTRLFLTFASLLLVASMVGCKKEDTSKPATSNTNRAAQSTPDQFAATRGIFAKNCQNCHGATGDGGPVKLEDGSRLKVPSLRQGHAVRHGDPDFEKQINKGGDGMPAFEKKLTAEQINDLIRFIRHEFQGK